MSVRILLVWYLMNIMVSLVNTCITRTVLLQVSKDDLKSRFVSMFLA